MKTIKLHFLIFILFISCSDNNNNNNDVNENITKTYISKVTISEGPNYYNDTNSILTYNLNYDLNKKLTSIDANYVFHTNGLLTTNSATYNIVYENGQIVKAYTDCMTNDCYLKNPDSQNFEGTHQIYFEYGTENGYRSVTTYYQVLDNIGSVTSSHKISEYLLFSNNLIKQVEGDTEIVYSNNNAVGIQNASSFNDGLKYLNYDNKKSVVIYTDYTHVIDADDYFPRLILDLKYSKNNFVKLNFAFRNQHQIIDFAYDNKDRPTKRTVLNNDSFVYEETFEYLE